MDKVLMGLFIKKTADVNGENFQNLQLDLNVIREFQEFKRVNSSLNIIGKHDSSPMKVQDKDSSSNKSHDCLLYKKGGNKKIKVMVQERTDPQEDRPIIDESIDSSIKPQINPVFKVNVNRAREVCTKMVNLNQEFMQM